MSQVCLLLVLLMLCGCAKVRIRFSRVRSVRSGANFRISQQSLSNKGPREKCHLITSHQSHSVVFRDASGYSKLNQQNLHLLITAPVVRSSKVKALLGNNKLSFESIILFSQRRWLYFQTQLPSVHLSLSVKLPSWPTLRLFKAGVTLVSWK